MSTKVFATGFGNFSATSDNPSARVVAQLGIPYRVLEVTWSAVDAWLSSGEPDEYEVLLHLGFADRKHLTPELFARNNIGTHADVAGVVKTGEIEEGGPLLLEANLWTPEVLEVLIGDHRVIASEDAGTYLCNFISYRSLRAFPNKRVGFLHVPGFEVVSEEEQVTLLQQLVAKLHKLRL